MAVIEDKRGWKTSNFKTLTPIKYKAGWAGGLAQCWFLRPTAFASNRLLLKMCEYTRIDYICTCVRYTIRAWCTTYETTHKRCSLNVVAIEERYSPHFL
jgi:hypothetical protein